MTHAQLGARLANEVEAVARGEWEMRFATTTLLGREVTVVIVGPEHHGETKEAIEEIFGPVEEERWT